MWSQVPTVQDSAHLTVSPSNSGPPFSGGARGHGMQGAVSYPSALREDECVRVAFGGCLWGLITISLRRNG